MPTIDEPTWWIASGEYAENWEGPYATRDEAIAEAEGNDYDWICCARQALYSASDLIDHCDVEHMIEAWADNSEMAGEDGETPFDHWTEAHKKALTDHLKTAADEWMKAAGLTPRAAWVFHSSERAERVLASTAAEILEREAGR